MQYNASISDRKQVTQGAKSAKDEARKRQKSFAP